MNEKRRGVYVGRIDTPAALPGAPLLLSESEAAWVPDASDARFGDLRTVNQRRIEVRRFDAERLMLIGDVRALEWRVGEQTPYHPSMLSASPTTLAFASDRVPFGQRLASVDRTGDHLQRQEAEAQGWVRLSPDGRRLARQRIVDGPENPDIWVDDSIAVPVCEFRRANPGHLSGVVSRRSPAWRMSRGTRQVDPESASSASLPLMDSGRRDVRPVRVARTPTASRPTG